MKYPAISLVLLLSATAAGSAQRVSPAYQPFLSYVSTAAGRLRHTAVRAGPGERISGRGREAPEFNQGPVASAHVGAVRRRQGQPGLRECRVGDRQWVPGRTRLGSRLRGRRGLPPGIHQRQQFATRGKQGTEDSGHLKRRHSGIFHRRGLRCELRRLRGLLAPRAATTTRSA